MRTVPHTPRIRFEVFGEADKADLARILAEPEVTRHITANGSDESRCLEFAGKRIDWHNRFWESRGYGVWALRAGDPAVAGAGELLGWCGFVPPAGPGESAPEILYALAPRYWGRGLAGEAARASIEWLFDNSHLLAVTAVISGRLNPASVKVVRKLGMTDQGRMAFTEFLPDPELAGAVFDYEIWRLRESTTGDLHGLVEQAAYRAGQLVCACSFGSDRAREKLAAAVASRCRNAGLDATALLETARRAEESGENESYMDTFRISRDQWLERQRATDGGAVA